MIYFLHGTDTEKARDKAHELFESLQKKKPEAAFFRIEAEKFSPAELDELIGSQGLFEKKYIVFLDQVFASKEHKETMLEKLPALAESPNIFIFLEGKVDKASLAKIIKRAEKVQEFLLTEPKSAGKGDFNIFALADAFGSRDKKQLWLIYQKAAMHNVPAEEIHGLLFWSLKSMLLANAHKTATEAGINPYVFQKSQRFANNFKREELNQISRDFVQMYHDAHRGLIDFDTALEKFILNL